MYDLVLNPGFLILSLSTNGQAIYNIFHNSVYIYNIIADSQDNFQWLLISALGVMMASYVTLQPASAQKLSQLGMVENTEWYHMEGTNKV